jgi:hypothetical protein
VHAPPPPETAWQVGHPRTFAFGTAGGEPAYEEYAEADDARTSDRATDTVRVDADRTKRR